MGIFDIDSGADNHLLNEQFHVFSKSPASVATALGDASNRSGHTVTASDVWGQEIPAFFYAKTQAVADTYKSLAKTNDLCRIGNSVAIFENGDWVVKYNSYTDIPDGHKFKNAAGDDVIRFHKNRLAYNLNLDNNAADDGLNTTAKIQGWDEENSKVYDYVATAPKFVTQFVTSTDKIVDGIPSKGFGPFVMAGTTTGDITKVLPEGTSDQNHYIANSFAGIIQFNKARTDAIYVHAFEYCGKTLKSAYSDITELAKKVESVTATAGEGVQAVTDAAATAGLSVSTKEITVEGQTDPVTVKALDIDVAEVSSQGVITSSDEDKLVTATGAQNIAGKVASDKIDVATLTTPDGSSDAIKDATDTSKLVTAEQVKTYVTNNAQVTVKVDDTVEPTTNLELAGSTGTDVNITATADTSDGYKVTFGATIDKATVTDGVIDAATGNGDKVISATAAKTVAEKAIETALADTTENSLGATIASKVADVTVDDSSIVGDDKVAKLTTTGTDAIEASSESASTKLATEASVAKTAKTLDGKIESKVSSVTGPSEGHVKVTTDASTKAVTITVSDIASAGTLSQVKTTADSAIQTVKVNNAAVTKNDTEVNITALTAVDSNTTGSNGITIGETADKKVTLSVTPATYTKKNGQTPGSWGDVKTNFATAQSVSDAIADAVSAIETPTLSTSSTGVGLSASGHTVDITTANYTPAVGETAASWTNKPYLVTGATVEAFVGDETAKALKEAKAYSDSLHSTNLVYIVLGDTETLPTASADTVGKIYLVKEGNTANGETSIDAISGSYVEYMTRQVSETEYTWEKIGTTAADLSNYITKKDIAAVTTTITAAQTSADKKLASITNDGDSRVIVGEATADGDEKSISIKLADTVAIKSDITSAIDAIDVGVKSVKVADNSALVGTSVTTTDGAVTIKTDDVVENAAIPANTVRVENGLCYDGSGAVIAPIATEKIKSISSIPETLTTWIGDMPIWTGGDLSAATNLTTFLADMSSVSTTTLIGGKLDADSVESILYTIGEVSSDTLTLGVSSDGSAAIAEFMGEDEELTSYSYKGWTINVTKVNA